MPRSSIKKLKHEEQQKLLLGLCEALAVVKNLKEAANLLADLLSPAEQEMLAKRLQVAKFLLEDKNYSEIVSALKVSRATIAKVNAWLQESGAGYRLVFERQSKKNIKIPEYISSRSSDWNTLKRRHPMHYWPQLLLEEIVRTANNRQRQKLLNTLKVLKKSRQKYVIFKEIESILRSTNPRRQKFINDI